MNGSRVDETFRVDFHQGSSLDPCRALMKNLPAWTVSSLIPHAWSQAHPGSDSWLMQTECLAWGGKQTVLDVTVRFLQPQTRTVQLDAPVPGEGQPAGGLVGSIAPGGKHWHTWEEAVERELQPGAARLGELVSRPRLYPFRIPLARTREPLGESAGEARGFLVREQQELQGTIELSAAPAGGGLYRVTVRILNETPLAEPQRMTRGEVMPYAMGSPHTVLHARGGEWVSLLDPPGSCLGAVRECRNVGAWPILLGRPGERDTMLASPIILRDHPEAALESLRGRQKGR